MNENTHESVDTKLSDDTPLAESLSDNLKNISEFTGGSSDVIIKTGMVCGCHIAVLTCEGMVSTNTLAELVYGKLNDLGNSASLPPDALLAHFFEVYMIAAEQLKITTIGDLTLKLQSGFAIVLIDGCSRAIGIGV